MPNITFPADPTINMRATMLDAIAAPANSGWVEVAGWDKITIHIQITGTGTVQVLRSNKPSPLTAADGIEVGTDLTTSAFVEIKSPSRFIMINCTAVSGSVSAWLEAV